MGWDDTGSATEELTMVRWSSPPIQLPRLIGRFGTVGGAATRPGVWRPVPGR